MCQEPIFSRQEQGVVYLFSRYWEKLKEFQNKRICRIHTHFPDFSIQDISTGEIEGIEFEYNLWSFYAHVPDDIKKLERQGVPALYIVYWDQDADEGLLRKKIEAHYSGTVTFVRLSKYFSPRVNPGANCLGTSWVFNQSKSVEKAYPFDTIDASTRELVDQGKFRTFQIDKSLYRTVGFNKSGSDFIECDHWRAVHLFTTTTCFNAGRMPCRLFVRPTGCGYFYGYFDIKHAFAILSDDEEVEDYFRDFYFYPYDPDYRRHKCFVYSRFKDLTYEQGVSLFNYLNPNYTLGVRGSLVIENSEHIRQINGIVRG